MKKNSKAKAQKSEPIVYVIGDVHGCIAELSDMLVAIMEDAGSEPIEIYLIGDLIDKGPSPDEVTKLVMSGYRDITIKSIMGNHEEKFIRWQTHENRIAQEGGTNPVTRHYDYNGLAPYLEYFRSLPVYIHLPDYNVLLVHAGIEPKMKTLPPVSIEMCRRYEKNILRTRFVNPEGKMIPLGEENLEAGDRWWADVYDGRFGTVIYGHQAFSEVEFDKHAIGIDTGCAYGNKLTALRLSKDGAHKVIQIPARKKYASSYDEE